MKKHFNFDHILAANFSGSLTEKEKAALDEWIESSSENRQIFKNAEKVWKSLDLLQEMKSYNTAHALDNFHIKINKEKGNVKWEIEREISIEYEPDIDVPNDVKDTDKWMYKTGLY